MAQTQLNLGVTNILNLDYPSWVTGHHNNTVITGGDEGDQSRSYTNADNMSLLLHADLITVLIGAGLSVYSVTSDKLDANYNNSITKLNEIDGEHVWSLAICHGDTSTTINTYADSDLSSYDQHTTNDTGIGTVIAYTASGASNDIANHIRANDVTPENTYTNSSILIDCCTPIGFTKGSGSDYGYITWITFTDTTEAGLKAALADYIA